MMVDRRSAIGTILLAALLLAGCAGAERPATPAPSPSVQAALGDTWLRPADRMLMVHVPAGTFRMGSSQEEIDGALAMCQRNSGNGTCRRVWFENEFPQHAVTLDAFWIDRTEVTMAQYRQCVQAGHCEEVRCATGLDPKRDDQPAACVDWSHAAEYCKWAGARLPTEAEWEYAARGPDGNIFPWGDTFDPARLNYCDANCTYEWRDAGYDDGHETTAPVGSYTAGASWCGALDMAGNAWEWVADWYAPDYYARSPDRNPRGPDMGKGHVMKGGSCYYFASYVRSARRTLILPSTGETNNSGSFRCAASALP